MFIVYILHSSNLNKYYIGYSCSDVDIRLEKHLANHKGFTGITNDWVVVYYEVFNSKEEDYSTERNIKAKKSRKYIEKLVDG